MYLFDTDSITNLFKLSPSEELVGRIKRIPPEQQFISTITIYEIVYGACQSDRKEHHLRNLQELLLPTVRIVGFDAKAAYVCGTLRAELEADGVSLSLTDLEIASIALTNDLTLITGNIRHFKDVKRLRIENWLRRGS